MATAPRPPKRPQVVPSPHGEREDEYFWLRDDTREDPEILEHLRAENAHTTAILAGAAELENTLFEELVGRMPKDDDSPPVFDRGYWYYVRFEGELEYAIHARRKASLDAPEEVLLDENQLAGELEFFSLGDYDVSPDGERLAFSVDTRGRRQYTIHVIEIASRRALTEPIENTTGEAAWAADGETLFYVEKDPVTLLGRRLRRHQLGVVGDDALVYEELDSGFYMELCVSGDHRYVMLVLTSTSSQELRAVATDRPHDALGLLIAREPGHEFDADHIGARWVICSNRGAQNFRLLQASDEDIHDPAQWIELVPHREEVLLANFHIFEDFYVVAERTQAIRRLRIRSWDGTMDELVPAGEQLHTSWIDANPRQESTWIRYGYTSLVTPDTIYELEVHTKQTRLLKRQQVVGSFEAGDYASQRIWAVAEDGARIPISVVYRKSTALDGTAPAYLYGYGAYGSSTDAEFSRSMLSLLDRGFVYALAHVRGGHELGRTWYVEGRQHKKVNSFGDFISAAQALVESGLCAGDKLVASGGSAGGLLVTAAMNMRPDLFRVVVADVPFVDVVTTMLDESIPLTTNEYEEWGDPRLEADYRYQLGYSPYDNLGAHEYPAVWVTAGLWDSQVQYFEPAKYVARLRDCNLGERPVLLRVNLDAGHGGPSGRFRLQRERAQEFTFILQELGRAAD